MRSEIAVEHVARDCDESQKLAKFAFSKLFNLRLRRKLFICVDNSLIAFNFTPGMVKLRLAGKFNESESEIRRSSRDKKFSRNFTREALNHKITTRTVAFELISIVENL